MKRVHLDSFPHELEREIRPLGGFEDFFNDHYEEFIWDSYGDDFLISGYERYNSGLVDKSKAVKRLQAPQDPGFGRRHEVSRTLWEMAEQPRPLSEAQERTCHELFAIQGQVHPVPAMRDRFRKASNIDRMTRQFVRNLAASVMEPTSL